MGKLIVIDGTDGSGKETQSKLLCEKLSNEGYNCRRISFPNYDSWSSTLVVKYLEGELGKDISKLSPYGIASFYSADRYISYIQDWKEFYEKEDSIIIADRYVPSCIVYQSMGFESKGERFEFSDWLVNYEYNLLGLPRPDKVIVLMVDPDVSRKLINARGGSKRDNSSTDIHEENLELLKKVYAQYSDMAIYNNWDKIHCDNYMKYISSDITEDDIKKNIVIIHNKVYEKAMYVIKYDGYHTHVPL